ncbi:matrixin family metalloprotease [Haematospirillum jordaniae]|uniref:M10 family metallopeptidase C-terminal domain-containing protein n=1 Tax=Haematospirillum jordaniae TaxID=1549855 RepID=UPI001432BF41|nr:M10 family metallopeptidase C-terminal domain-containing protein [Haematospirillum jordaniae]NKD45804.1 matrixin family metalloprotease [Haematospirillum jordaniae]NKD91994.1 matrixin family metalloprotease [Haematospirillum jordaniae]
MSAAVTRYNSASNVSASGQEAVDSLLHGKFWSSDGAPRKPLELTYSFVSPEYEHVTTHWQEGLALDPSFITDGLRSSIAGIFKQIEDFTRLSFTEKKGGGEPGRILIGASKTMDEAALLDAAAYAEFPDTNDIAGSVWFNPWYNTVRTDGSPGSQLHLTAMHEIGHTLGLKHTHDESEIDKDNFPVTQEYDSVAYSVMSYKPMIGGEDTGGFKSTPLTYMLNDMAALQYLYGKNMTTRTGDNRYDFAGKTYVYETIWDAGGNDTVSWSGRDTSANIDLTPGTLSFFGGVDTKSDPAAWDKDSGILGIAYDTHIENAEGGNGHDILRGNDGNNLLQGGRGNDLLEGRGGADHLTGGAGADVFVWRDIAHSGPETAERDTVHDFSPADHDRLDFSALDANTGMQGHQALTFSDQTPRPFSLWYKSDDTGLTVFADTSGDTREDFSVRLNGVTTLSAENLILDTARVTAIPPDNHVREDTIPHNEGVEGAVYKSNFATGPVTITLGMNEPTPVLVNGVQVAEIIDYNHLAGGAFDDHLTGNDLNNIFRSSGGHDTIDGQGGCDYMDYGEEQGHIVVTLADGGQSSVVRVNGTDKDTLKNIEAIIGGDGDDRITGNDGNNILLGNAGNDILKGGAGDDALHGGDGDDHLDGGPGNDFLAGGAGKDTVSYASYTDSLDVKLRGETWGTVSIGTGEKDYLHSIEIFVAGSGDDKLRVEQLTSTLSGGAGADTFSYNGSSTSGTIIGGWHQILDFNAAEGDRIDLSHLSQGLLVNHFSNTGPARNAIWAEPLGKDLFLRIEATGDDTPDFSILLQNTSSLSASDFTFS